MLSIMATKRRRALNIFIIDNSGRMEGVERPKITGTPPRVVPIGINARPKDGKT